MINVYDAVEIIDGKLYDTSIAREIFSHEKILEKIFVMPKGDYFTAKIESVGENMLLRGKMVYRVYLRYCNITPISQKNVMDIVKQLDESRFRELFAINGKTKSGICGENGDA